jgi:hypothetical protein
MTRILCGLAVAGLAAGVTRADVESGAKAGEKVGELKAFGVVGKVEGKEADFAAERKDEPTVYLFVSAENFSRPIARFMKTLDGKLGEIDDKAAGVAVWLTDDADKSKEYLPKAQGSLKLDRTSLAVVGDKAGPNGWGINPDAHLTVVVANKGKVAKSFAYTSVNETDVRAVLAELKKAAGK